MSVFSFIRLVKYVMPVVCILYFNLTVFQLAHASEYLSQGKKQLTGAEIKAKLIGNSVTGTSVETGVLFTVYYPVYGEIRGEAGPWGMFTDEGVWVIKDGLYCVTWNEWADKELCLSVYIDGNAVSWVKPDGELLSVDTFVVGNPAEL